MYQITKKVSILIFLVTALCHTSLNSAYAEGGFISGKVTGSDGKTPIAGVRVAASQIVKESEDFGLGFAETNNKGEYVIEDLPAGSYEVIASFSGFADATKSNISVASLKVTSDIDFILLKYGSISGRITENDGASPIPNAEVMAIDVAASVSLNTSQTDGSFKVEKLLPGTYTIEADIVGYTFLPVKGVILAEGEEVKGIMIKAQKKHLGKISGRVTKSDGITPITGVNISVIPQTLEASDDLLGQKTISGVGGSYVIEGLPGGTYVLQAVKSGFALNIRTLTLSEGIPVTINISLLTTYGSISGYVFKEDGITPVVDARVNAFFS